MNIILLSGGSGKRLWPLSNDTRSKQFLKLLKNEQGEFESMVQRVFGQIKKAGIEANIVVATVASQVDSIRSQLGDHVDIVLEPERRDTFPAIALSSAYLALEKKVDLDEVVLVLPVDPYADIEYFHTLIQMEDAVKKRVADIVLMGIKPTYPSAKYGYIVPVQEDACSVRAAGDLYGCNVYKVAGFKEKPAEAVAERLIADGAVWNGGVFAFKLGFMMGIVNKSMDAAGIEGFSSFEEVRQHYSSFKKNSFDYEVVEKATSVAMVPYEGSWKDLGTWNTLTEEMDDECVGLAIVAEDTVNTHVINELSIPIVVLGAKDMIVAASPDGILVSDKQKSSYLKSYVDGINERPMYEERRWGNYKLLDYNL
jgi:mannose-1-phosphate guanylyltransferase